MRLSIAVLSLLLVSPAFAGFPDPDGTGVESKTGIRGGADPTGNEENGSQKDKYGPSPDEVDVIIRYRKSSSEAQALSDLSAFAVNGRVKNVSSRLNIVSMRTKKINKEAILSSPHVEFAEPDFRMKVLPFVRGSADVEDTQNDRRLMEETPYGIEMVQSDLVPIPNGPRIKICVVDTGYGNGHPDLPTRSQHGVTGYKPPSYDGTWNKDGHGHGTHCAGTIGAIAGNGVGVIGVNEDPDKFRFVIGKGLEDTGSGSSSAVLQAVEECVTRGAKVISMSLGGGGFSQTQASAYASMYNDNDVLIIAAAGNGGNSAYSYPASYPHVMSVAAVDSGGNRASFSQFNDQVEIAGPGVSVKSTITTNNGNSFSYASWSGTSMATPHVAGVAALLWSHFPGCTNSQIRNVMLKSTQEAGSPGCDTRYGHGIVKAKAAYDLLQSQGCEAGGTDVIGVGGCPQKPTTCTKDADCDDGNACNGVETCDIPTKTCQAAGDLPSVGELEISILTDDYPGETGFTVTDMMGTQLHSMQQGTLSRRRTVETMTVPIKTKCEKVMVTISDRWGDGICCSYGPGSYTVKFDGTEVATGGQFGATETIEVSVPLAVPPTPVPPDTFYYLACGSSYQQCSGQYDLEEASKGNEVRCCSDSNKSADGWIKRSTCKVWGESDILPTNPRCLHNATWEEANAACLAAGGRLCTANELLDDCTSGSGCLHDKDMIWSATPGPIVSSSLVMEWGTLSSVNDTAELVNTINTYNSPVIVSTINDADNSIPVVTRISDVTSTSFRIKLQLATGSGTVVPRDVSYFVIEEGVYNVNGAFIEAQKYTSTITDRKSSWVGQKRTLNGIFSKPVVVGQVMSSNDEDWSVFWTRGADQTEPPSSGYLKTGKSVAEDSNTVRVDETVGFVVFEAGSGTISGIQYKAKVGSDTIRGVDNGAVEYTFDTAFSTAPSVSLATMAGVDGNDGGWAHIAGMSPTTISLVIDEDTFRDTERSHTNEQCSYVAFETRGDVSA